MRFVNVICVWCLYELEGKSQKRYENTCQQSGWKCTKSKITGLVVTSAGGGGITSASA